MIRFGSEPYRPSDRRSCRPGDPRGDSLVAMAMFGKKKKKPDDASDDGAEPQPALDNTAYQPDPARPSHWSGLDRSCPDRSR